MAKQTLKTIKLAVLILLGVAVIAGGMWLWTNRKRVDVYLWVRRPDIALALAQLDQITPVEELDWRHELAVRYLIGVESDLLYYWLRGWPVEQCSQLAESVLGYGDFAVWILGEKESERSIEILLDIFRRVSLDVMDCDQEIAAEGLALKGEEVVPYILEIAADESLDYYQRDRALWWLASMGSEEHFLRSHCQLVMSCEPLGPEVGAEWVDLLIDVMVDDPSCGVQRAAAHALYRIGDPRGIEAMRQLHETTTCSVLQERLAQYLEELGQ